MQQAIQPEPKESEDRIGKVSGNLLERGDSIIYAVVGICFILGSLVALGYSFWDFGYTVFTQTLTPGILAGSIIQLVSDLLLVLIIIEVLGTVTNYLKSHTRTLTPYLYIGIISATRGILSVASRLTVGGHINFNEAMIELGVDGAVILALGITIKLLGNEVEN